jgi:hypothetical protein
MALTLRLLAKNERINPSFTSSLRYFKLNVQVFVAVVSNGQQRIKTFKK